MELLGLWFQSQQLLNQKHVTSTRGNMPDYAREHRHLETVGHLCRPSITWIFARWGGDGFLGENFGQKSRNICGWNEYRKFLGNLKFFLGKPQVR